MRTLISCLFFLYDNADLLFFDSWMFHSGHQYQRNLHNAVVVLRFRKLLAGFLYIVLLLELEVSFTWPVTDTSASLSVFYFGDRYCENMPLYMWLAYFAYHTHLISVPMRWGPAIINSVKSAMCFLWGNSQWMQSCPSLLLVNSAR